MSGLHGHICPYRNVWPEAVYCCFTRTTLFVLSELEVAITSPSFVTLYLMVDEIAKCICLFKNYIVYYCYYKNSSHFKKVNIGMANMHKKQRRQDRDGDG